MKVLCRILIVLIVLTTSCRKKEFPESVTEADSEFYFSAAINNVPVLLKPAKDNYYMFSSYKQESNGLYSFLADLKPANCGSCANSLQVRINDFEISPINAPAKIEKSLATGSYVLQAKPGYKVRFNNIYNQTASSYLWDFGDNNTSTDANPEHIFDKPNYYNVSLRINGTNGCQQYIKNKENLKDTLLAYAINVESLSANMMKFSTDSRDSSFSSYLWNFGDGSTSSIINPVHNYNISGTYPVSLRIVTANRDTIYARRNVATITNPMPCLVNYRISSVSPVPGHLLPSQVAITWTDENGTVFSSNNALQPADSFFRIVSVDSFDNNEKGEKTKKIRIVFKCTVYNGTIAKTINNAEALLCVSYR